MGALHDRLKAEPDPAKRLQIKAEAINERAFQLVGRTMTRGRFTMTLTSISVAPSAAGPVVTLTVRIVNDNTGNDVTPSDLNPIVLVNPPILVPDPNGEIELGDEQNPRPAREDVIESLLSALRDVLRSRVG